MRGTRIAHEDGFLLHNMIPLAESCAWIHGMPVIETAACRIALNHLVAHDDDGRV